ncbi:hypothetical protein DNTS_003882 [Danionella cerebrum]|uniref:Uncharacterized protein n=1 Tax=Danionella cerebrum TaxID=2873325 RepID=A0A553N2E8_9TELE|nr:hypothetical protein DNTS_003882 [Danionella translucida]
MATSTLNSIRVRLYFDYPPPATPESRMCWLLVDLNKCRVVADLSSIIKEKLGYSRKTILDLFIEDCYLPSTESIYVVRDNDSVRVKVSSPVHVNGAEDTNNDTQNSKTKKRAREDETQICGGLGKKKKSGEPQENGLTPAKDDKKKKKKKKKKMKEVAAKSATQQDDHATISSTKTNRKSGKINHTKNLKPPSSSSDSSEDESLKKAPPPRPKPNKKTSGPVQKQLSSSDSLSSSSSDTEKTKSNKKLLVTPKPSSTNAKLQPQTPQQSKNPVDSPSSSSSSSSAITKAPLEANQSSAIRSSPQPLSSSKNPQGNAESSDSEESEIELVIRKPNLHGMGLKIAGVSPGVGDSGGRGHVRSQERQRGRGANRGSGRGGFGRARGTPWKQDFHYNYENNERQKQNDSLTNESFIIQNPTELAPKRDYSALPLLAAPPAVGQKIAFKLLELTENYTPEVSDYKEGKILGFNSLTKVIELELLTQPQGPTEPGKFDLVYQNPDGSESVEYAVTHGLQLTERWDSLLEPRLIVEKVG